MASMARSTSRCTVKAAAFAYMKKALKRHGSPQAITTDGLRSLGRGKTKMSKSDPSDNVRFVGHSGTAAHKPKSWKADVPYNVDSMAAIVVGNLKPAVPDTTT